MKKVIIFLLMVLAFTSCQSSTNAPEVSKMTSKVDAIVDIDYQVDSTAIDTVYGDPIQVVYLANGDKMIFSDAYKSVSDLDIKLNYMTYRKIQSYESLKDSLTSINPETDSGIIDLLCFNHFLDRQGLQVITKEQYSSLIAQSNQVERMDTVVKALYFLIGLIVIFMAMLVISLLAVAKKTSDILEDNNVFISKADNTC